VEVIPGGDGKDDRRADFDVASRRVDSSSQGASTGSTSIARRGTALTRAEGRLLTAGVSGSAPSTDIAGQDGNGRAAHGHLRLPAGHRRGRTVLP
jgi:hypothetical protein